MRDFSGARLKLARARHHLATLIDSIEDYVRASPHTLSLEAQHDTNRIRVLASRSRPVPADWAAMVGDFAHNTRSALDLLVFQLSLLSEADTRRRNLGFPIVTHPSRFPKAKGDRLIQVSSADCAIIEAIQPFNSVSNPHVHPLMLLEVMNNYDKHRLLHVVAGESKLPRVKIGGVQPGDPAILIEHGVSIGGGDLSLQYLGDGRVAEVPTPMLEIGMGEKNHAITFGFVFDVKFDNCGPPELHGRQVRGTLESIADTVDNVIARF